jgi:alanyl-tRNA synthetase
MTKRLFWEDPYIKQFKTSVKEIGEGYVVLEESCFYPESGGQVGDTGFIDSSRVIDTKLANNTIHHILAEPPQFSAGQEVECKIDWDRRYRIMKLHSAAHLAYYALVDLYGKPKVIGSHVTDTEARVDLQYFGPFDLDKFGTRLNDVISRNLDIKTWTKPSDPNFRYWKVGTCPEMPCGGTHVRNTKEIGPVGIRRKSLGKQGMRIYLVLEKSE